MLSWNNTILKYKCTKDEKLFDDIVMVEALRLW